jgi:hypothetical protein
VRVTLQASEPAPVREAFVQLKPLSAALDGALSSKPNVSDTPLALAVKVTVWVVAAGATVAVKLALVAFAGTSTLAGIDTRALLLLERLTVNPAAGAAAVSVTLQLSVPAPVTDGMLQLIALSAEDTALSATAKVFDTVPALAVSVAVWADATAVMVAVKLALVALAATRTVAGRETAVLLLDKFTESPPDGAADVSVTLQVSEPAPVIDALLQLIPLSVAVTALS